MTTLNRNDTKHDIIRAICSNDALHREVTLDFRRIPFSEHRIFENADWPLILDALSKNTNVRQISIAFSSINGDVPESTYMAIFTHPKITAIHLNRFYSLLGDPTIAGRILKCLGVALKSPSCILDAVRLEECSHFPIELLTDALKVNTSLSVLALNNVGLSSLQCCALVSSLKENNTMRLKALDLKNNQIGNEGLDALSSYIMHQSCSLTTLIVRNNNICDVEPLIRALKNHATLKDIDVRGHHGLSNVGFLVNTLKSHPNTNLERFKMNDLDTMSRDVFENFNLETALDADGTIAFGQLFFTLLIPSEILSPFPLDLFDHKSSIEPNLYYGISRREFRSSNEKLGSVRMEQIQVNELLLNISYLKNMKKMIKSGTHLGQIPSELKRISDHPDLVYDLLKSDPITCLAGSFGVADAYKLQQRVKRSPMTGTQAGTRKRGRKRRHSCAFGGGVDQEQEQQQPHLPLGK